MSGASARPALRRPAETTAAAPSSRLAAAGGPVTVAALAEQVRAAKRRRLKPVVLREWERSLDTVILPALGDHRLAELSADELAALIENLEARGLAPASIRSYLKPLSAILKLALRRGLLETNPLELLQPDERPASSQRRRAYEWTAESIGRLLRQARLRGERPQARYSYHPPLATLALTGIRAGELLGLRNGDLDLDAGLIRIRHSWSRDGHLTSPKTAASIRDLPLPDELASLLAPLRSSSNRDGWLFPSRSGRQPLSYWNLAKRGLKPALADAGLSQEGIRLHDLRHAAASLLIAAGLTPVEVAAQLGHADPGVTLKIYAHLFDRRRSHERTRAAFGAVRLD